MRVIGGNTWDPLKIHLKKQPQISYLMSEFNFIPVVIQACSVLYWRELLSAEAVPCQHKEEQEGLPVQGFPSRLISNNSSIHRITKNYIIYSIKCSDAILTSPEHWFISGNLHISSLAPRQFPIKISGDCFSFPSLKFPLLWTFIYTFSTNLKLYNIWSDYF